MVKQRDITSLKRAREVVHSIQRSLSTSTDFGEGRVVQACEDADHAIFQVLVLLDVFGLKAVDDDALFPLRGQIENKSTGTNGDGKDHE